MKRWPARVWLALATGFGVHVEMSKITCGRSMAGAPLVGNLVNKAFNASRAFKLICLLSSVASTFMLYVTWLASVPH